MYDALTHLLQSTLFAGVAGLLTLALKKNHARARYCLWLAASVKFLIPFSVLVDLGSRFGWSTGRPLIRSVIATVEETSRTVNRLAQDLVAPAATQPVRTIVPKLLPIVWS